MAKTSPVPAAVADSSALAAELLQHLEMFRAFARKRVADPELAADVVQDSLLKALKSAGQLRTGESVVPWFYRILRRTILDLYRRQKVRQQVMAPLPEDFEAAAMEPETMANLCGCLRALLPGLKPEYAQAIETVDLGEASLAEAAAKLDLPRNTLKVRLHRARRQMHERLMQTCRVCARHGCLDCDCANADRQQ